MAYIYEITNDINNKKYIGKTEGTIEKRFQEHCRDAFRRRCEKRPLYAAMRKYGIEHFHISLLEETDNPEERECYWIEKLSSFKYGYNATIGGDGKKYLDYDLILKTYSKINNCNEVAKILNISSDSVRKVL
jgi:group I intron endonuclease